ncbi:MAG: hypothetical protein M1828_000920 [Chrysothrix sp. TS-e1954]|nr:MAG: hypothetical protein M1828_000920 [Chrysothrix sp. TS-e1954]
MNGSVDGSDDEREASPQEMEAPLGNGKAPMPNGMSSQALNDVIHSDIGINVLLSRLKQSIASARDFAGFLKQRSVLEDEHAQGLKKMSRTTYESAQKSENRQGSYALQLADVTRIHERMAENGITFSRSLLQMQEDLKDMSLNIERGRKHWKQEGLNNEKKVKDAESQLEKAKSRYDNSAVSYDKARTGDSSGRAFGIKGPKSAEQREEDLHRKVQAADADYAAKVQAAQSQRQENTSSLRPQAVKALQELITECDSALTLQLQKFAAINEKLLVSNGLVVSPIKGEGADEASGILSMRDLVGRIDNERDFYAYVTGQSSNLPARPAEIKYEKHPALGGSASAPMPAQRAPTQPSAISQPISQPASTNQTPQTSLNQRAPTIQTSIPSSSGPLSGGRQVTPDQSFRGPPTLQTSIPTSSNGLSSPSPASQPMSPAPAPTANSAAPRQAPQLPTAPADTFTKASPTTVGRPQKGPNGVMLPSNNPVFGMSLEALFRRDDSAVPMVVYQCIQAVDLFGLDVEGIYRVSGNSAHISMLRALFDHDSSRVDFRNPATFFQDVNSVAGLLKQFFRDLPDPLFTSEHYNEFIDGARLEDPAQRRDSLHAIINALPDPNYATLRAVILHLNRIVERQERNRMSSSNVALCFAPTLMGQHTGPHMADAGLQARVLDSILQHTYEIFDED